MAIDENANHPSVRKFFVSHEGKKTLTVTVGPSIYGVDYAWFFKEMTSQISENINNPEYTYIMESDFSTSTPVQKIVNQIMLMYSFQKYFEYSMFTMCGIPGVIMLGTRDDWCLLTRKLDRLETFLKPIDDVLGLEPWFKTCKIVLQKLLDTYDGNPDKEWWSKIMNIHTSYGSGAGTFVGGWFVFDFMGMTSYNYWHLPSGINVVPMTITDGVVSSNASLAAGITGFRVTEADFSHPDTQEIYPSVQAVQGWALLLEPDSPFRWQN